MYVYLPATCLPTHLQPSDLPTFLPSEPTFYPPTCLSIYRIYLTYLISLIHLVFVIYLSAHTYSCIYTLEADVKTPEGIQPRCVRPCVW